MFIPRRGFLLSSAGLITSSFVKDARAFIRRKAEPLLLTPRAASQTLYVMQPLDKFQAALGSRRVDPHGKPPTWLGYARRFYRNKQNEIELDRMCEEWFLDPSELDGPVKPEIFEDLWYRHDGPCAKAYTLLEGLDLGPDFDGKGRHVGLIEFNEGGHPGDDSRWVDIEDELSVSLLQARLIELNLPIKVVVADYD